MMKKTKTLVLNKSWFPINVIDWERTMTLLSQDAVKALDRDLVTYNFVEWLDCSALLKDYPKVKTVGTDIAIPEIVILSLYDKIPKVNYRYTRERVFQRDNFTCGFCNKKVKRTELTIDHIFPKSKGGETSWTNTITACTKCNLKKGNKTLDEGTIKLHFKPSKPKWSSPVHHYVSKNKLSSWSGFVKA
jgi:5-methylcytosine-specific restriction endonuclease McrA